MSANVPRPPSEKPKAGFPIAILLAVGCLVAAPVLIAVVGILAAIAIPNYLKFQCKSKQSEAKVNLSGIFTAEKAFYGEYGFYTTDLKALNWQPDGSPLYLYGFVEAAPYEEDLPSGVTPPSDYDPERMDTSDPTYIGGSYSTSKMRDSTGYSLSPQDLPREATVAADGSSFRVAAIGDIKPNGYGTRLDTWTIDETKSLQILTNDCSY